MAGLNLRGSVATTFVAPSNPPSASGSSATAQAFGAAQVSGDQHGQRAAISGTAIGVLSLALLVFIWHSLPR